MWEPERPVREAERLRECLIRDGYGVVPGVLDQPMLAKLHEVTERMISRTDPTELAQQRTTGSMISVTEDSELARSLLDVETPEDDLFVGVREALATMDA